MARIIWLTDHPEPVNAGEERVLAHLAKNLPDSIALIPNLTIPYPRPDNPEEYDIIAVTPDAVFVVEVKDLAGHIEIDEQNMFVNGNSRRNPYLTTRIKAQKLKGRLSTQLKWFQQGGWVEHLVVLARQPASLAVCEAMKTRVVQMSEAVALINQSTPLLKPKFHGQLLGKETSILNCITAGAIERKRPTVFGDYAATSRILQDGSFEAWRATHQLTGADVLLEVYRLDPSMPAGQVTVWKSNCLRIESLANQIGASADIDAPRHSFELSDGTLVLVWPEREPNTLQHFLNQMKQEGSGFDAAKASKVLEGFSRALAHLHMGGWSIYEVKSHNLFVRANGFGSIVLGAPLPARSNNHSTDLHWLGGIVKQVNESINDQRLNDLAAELCKTRSEEQMTAIMALAVLGGVEFRPVVASPDILTRFTDMQTIATHEFGSTSLAIDSELKREVIVKKEAGRPDLSWATREYRMLSLPQLANNQHVVSCTSGGSSGDVTYVALERVEAPTLASMIDAGVLRDPKNALSVAVQILTVLNDLHPDIQGIEAVLASANGTLDEESQKRIGQLRDTGVAHNHLDASNIFVHPKRGVVLTDFVRAAKFGEVIPSRAVAFWPEDAPRNVSNPQADLFAVGSLLVRMLASSPAGINATDEGSDELRRHLVDVALKSIDANPLKRFRSASSFIDALVSNVVVTEIPVVADNIMELQKRIESLVNEHKFDEALKLCPADWVVTRERIEKKQKLINLEGVEILNIGGISLRHIGEIKIPPGATAENVEHNGGVAECYHSVDGDGGLIEVLVCAADTDQGPSRWTATGNGFGYPDRLQHAIRSLRITIKRNPGPNHMELAQAQLRRSPVHPYQSTKKMVNSGQLSVPLQGRDAGVLFSEFGANGFGTKANLWGDTSNRKNYLAVTFNDGETHVPAIAHFVSRILPLYAGIQES